MYRQTIFVLHTPIVYACSDEATCPCIMFVCCSPVHVNWFDMICLVGSCVHIVAISHSAPYEQVTCGHCDGCFSQDGQNWRWKNHCQRSQRVSKIITGLIMCTLYAFVIVCVMMFNVCASRYLAKLYSIVGQALQWLIISMMYSRYYIETCASIHASYRYDNLARQCNYHNVLKKLWRSHRTNCVNRNM